MKKLWVGPLALGVLTLGGWTALSQPPQQKQDRGKERPGQREPGGPPPRFELGRVLPPFARDRLDLTKEQEAKISELEKEVKERLTKILTAEQRKTLESLRPPGPGGPGGPPRGPDGPPPDSRDKPGDDQAASGPAAGIQWFATWATGLREAQRTGRPILLVSAAPHCAGVSGTW